MKIKLIFLFPFILSLISAGQLTAQCTWMQVADDIGFANASSEQVGYSSDMSADGSVVVLGALEGHVGGVSKGRVRVYEYSSGSDMWVQKGQELVGDVAGARFGYSVAINGSGSIIAVGAIKTTAMQKGYVAVYEFDSNTDTWNILGGGVIEGEENDDRFGNAVSLSADGQTLVAGALNNDGAGQSTGHARIFYLNNNSWYQSGQDIDGSTMGHNYGSSVSISGDGSLVAVGSNFETRVFELRTSDSTWIQYGSSIADDNSQGLPSAVALNSAGNILTIGNGNYDSYAGSVAIYGYNPTTQVWDQIGNSIDGDSEIRNLGHCVDINATGNIVVAGATYTNSLSGAVVGYQLGADSTWQLLGEVMYAESSGDLFGFSVGVSADGHQVVAGAPRNNHNLSYYHAGEVTVFEIDTSQCSGCSASIDTVFAATTIPCNSKIMGPEVLDPCSDSLLRGVPVDSSFYFSQGVYQVKWVFERDQADNDTITQDIMVEGVVVCDTIAEGIGSLQNALGCAEVGDTINIIDLLEDDQIILPVEGITINEDVIIMSEPGQNLTIDASMSNTAFTVNVDKTLVVDGVNIISGMANEGGTAINNGTLILKNTNLHPHPTGSTSGSRFIGTGELIVDPVSTIH